MSDPNVPLGADTGSNMAQYQQNYNRFTNSIDQLGNAAQGYSGAIERNFGGGSGNYLQNNYNASKGIAAEEAGSAASGAQQQAQQASATAGMSPAQAALLGANQSGQTYAQSYGQNLGNTMNQYNNATNMELGSRNKAADMQISGNQGLVNAANQKEQANAAMAGANASQTSANANQQNANTNTFGQIAGGVGSFLSGIF